MIFQTLFTGWNFMRWLRLFLGITIAFQAFQSHDWMLGLLSAFLLFQTATNTGCCGVQGCDYQKTKEIPGKTRDIDFEEIKSK